VPIVNPGPLTYKLAEFLLGLGLTQSRKAYPSPRVPKYEMLAAMLEGAAATETATA
jgi:allantoin racemase